MDIEEANRVLDCAVDFIRDAQFQLEGDASHVPAQILWDGPTVKTSRAVVGGYHRSLDEALSMVDEVITKAKLEPSHWMYDLRELIQQGAAR